MMVDVPLKKETETKVNYMVWSNYFYLIRAICLHTVLWFQVFLSNTNNLQAITWFQVTNNNNP